MSAEMPNTPTFHSRGDEQGRQRFLLQPAPGAPGCSRRQSSGKPKPRQATPFHAAFSNTAAAPAESGGPHTLCAHPAPLLPLTPQLGEEAPGRSHERKPSEEEERGRSGRASPAGSCRPCPRELRLQAACTDGYSSPKQPPRLIHRFAVPESLPFKRQRGRASSARSQA